ncbi:MAG: hypothetical protein Q9179_007448, partial [Wetmoreana sp. 5 TL-2023]
MVRRHNANHYITGAQKHTDPSRFPSFLREKVQATLTLLWIKRFPPFQATSPANVAIRALQSILGPTMKDYTFIDFCSGAGGPTPEFERQINRALKAESIYKHHAQNQSQNPRRRKDVNVPDPTNNNAIPTTSDEGNIDS